MNVAIYSQKIADQEKPFFQNLLQKMKELDWSPIFENNFYEQLKGKIKVDKEYNTFNSTQDFKKGIDLAISIGGDGTFLKCVSFVRDSQVPIIGINTGRLGFLADINQSDFETTLEKIIQKDYTLQKRSLIQVQTEDKVFGENNFALNELAIHKKDSASMITVEAWLGDEFLNAYWADGLLVGTPTGSTAYNLSCGGPIINPGSGVHFLTPIAAHNLNVRPLIVPDHLPIKLKAIGRSKKFLLALDSVSVPVTNGTEVIVTKADFTINIVKLPEHDFYSTIRRKMMWGIDQRNE